MRVMASLLFPNSNQGQHLVSRGIINLLSPEYAVTKCLIIANSIRDYNIMNRHRTCSPCLLFSYADFVISVQHKNNPQNFECPLPYFLHIKIYKED